MLFNPDDLVAKVDLDADGVSSAIDLRTTIGNGGKNVTAGPLFLTAGIGEIDETDETASATHQDYGSGTLSFLLSWDGGTTYHVVTTATSEAIVKILDGSYAMPTHLVVALNGSTSPDLEVHIYRSSHRPDGPTG